MVNFHKIYSVSKKQKISVFHIFFILNLKCFQSKFFFLISLSTLYRCIVNFISCANDNPLTKLREGSIDSPNWQIYYKSIIFKNKINRAIFLGFYMFFTDFLPVLLILIVYSASPSKEQSMKKSKNKKKKCYFYIQIFFWTLQMILNMILAVVGTMIKKNLLYHKNEEMINQL